MNEWEVMKALTKVHGKLVDDRVRLSNEGKKRQARLVEGKILVCREMCREAIRQIEMKEKRKKEKGPFSTIGEVL